MPRTPKGDRAMSGAERQRRYWEKQKAILDAAKAGQAPEQSGEAGDTREVDELRWKCAALERDIADLKRKLEQLRTAAVRRKRGLKPEEHKLVLACLHPDNSASSTRREAAFRIVSVLGAGGCWVNSPVKSIK